MLFQQQLLSQQLEMGKEIQSFVLYNVISLKELQILRRHHRQPHRLPLRQVQQQVAPGKRSASGLQNHTAVDEVQIASLFIPSKAFRRRTDATLVALKAINQIHAQPKQRAMIRGRSLKARPRRRVLQELHLREESRTGNPAARSMTTEPEPQPTPPISPTTTTGEAASSAGTGEMKEVLRSVCSFWGLDSVGAGSVGFEGQNQFPQLLSQP